MTWKKHFRVAPTAKQQPAANTSQRGSGAASGTAANFGSYLPEVYAGHPNRIQRYYQYDDMDRDSDINVALNTIADFCTQSEEQNEEPFRINYLRGANDSEVSILKQMLTKWVKRSDLKSKMWYIFRNTIKNGDSFFLRDPETSELLWIDHFSVLCVKVDETAGKEPDEYIIRGLDYNKSAKFATGKLDTSQITGTTMTPQVYGRTGGVMSSSTGAFALAGSHIDPRQQRMTQQANEISVVDARNVVHLSLSVGMDMHWPFGQSILEPIFKTYKQKELLEDSILIYRVQRAPERRIFYIDTGDMPPARAKAHIMAMKNEIHQRRIPTRSATGASMLDASYNPLSMMEDYFFAQSADGRGSKVETLPGGDNLGEIGDLDYFTRKLARGLNIPSSYLSLSDDSSNVSYNDGKLGAAIIQEFRFNKYCMRLQSLLAPTFDREFKTFLKSEGIVPEIAEIFELQFNPPQNFTKYRQIELDQQQVGVFQMIENNKKLSERFKLKRFLNLTDDEILENERMWAEENPKKVKNATGTTSAESDSGPDLSAVGIRPMGGDLDFGDLPGDDFGGEQMGDLGGPGGAGAPVDATAMGGGGGAPPPPPPAAGGATPLA